LVLLGDLERAEKNLTRPGSLFDALKQDPANVDGLFKRHRS
jgi:hypothetical protein